MGVVNPPVPGSPYLPPWFEDVLEAIDQFGLASIGLVAWELFLSEVELVPAWRGATILGLIERVGRCPYTREPMYRLTRPLRIALSPPVGEAFTTTFLDTAPVNVVTCLPATNSPTPHWDESPQPI
jgi:hypothetical protein